MQSSGQLAGWVFKKIFENGWRAPESRVLAKMKFFWGILRRAWQLLLERGFAPSWGVR
jgi:hypothetical protein